jgi:hypothetical protein
MTLDYRPAPDPLYRKLRFWRIWALVATVILLLLAAIQPADWWRANWFFIRHPNGGGETWDFVNRMAQSHSASPAAPSTRSSPVQVDQAPSHESP